MQHEHIIGIDLGTTNSEVAVVLDGRPVVLGDPGETILPSVVGLDAQGRLLVGKAARNQLALAPDRTIRSIKRRMGHETTVPLGDQRLTPQEVSAIILKTLKERAERALGTAVTRAVITVPAFFNDGQRQATRQAGELAGLEVVRIINEPTAAVLTYNPHPPEQEQLLVYDLGGGTFDVSIARVENGVVEIQSSHGDAQLGGDDFDQLLLDLVRDRFLDQTGVDLSQGAASRARVLRAVEAAKERLSFESVAVIEEEFIAERDGRPLNLVMDLARGDYEALIAPLLQRTLDCVDRALEDARLDARRISKVILVGGATRTPLVKSMLEERLGRPVHGEIEPDLAVAMGAAVQGALIAGVNVGPILIDITPHSLGISALGPIDGAPSPFRFSTIIPRNTPLPASRSEVYTTVLDDQEAARIAIFQGEDRDSRRNAFVGDFLIEGLANAPAGNQVLVKLDLDLSGILKVTARERATGLAREVVIESAAERFRMQERSDAVDRLEAVFASRPRADQGDHPVPATALGAARASTLRQALESAQALARKAAAILPSASAENAAELRQLLATLDAVLERQVEDEIRAIAREVEDLVFYLEDV